MRILTLGFFFIFKGLTLAKWNKAPQSSEGRWFCLSLLIALDGNQGKR